MTMSKPVDPVIKWSGSKRKIAPVLSRLLPEATCYFEPFVGSGAMLPFRPCPKGVAGDIIPELIALWVKIRDVPDEVIEEYECRWKRLQTEGHTAYYEIRNDFNTTRNAHDFLFLTRTCVNGLIRFNHNGDFNNSLHHSRPGIAPGRLRKLVFQWSYAIQDVTFLAADYRNTLETAGKNDLVFLDPPYEGTRGRYQPKAFDFDDFFSELERLNQLEAKWILTLDGNAGKRKYATSIPNVLYQVQLGLTTGNSPFTKLMKTSLDSVVESVYLNFVPPTEALNQVLNGGHKKASSVTALNMHQNRLFD